MNVFSPNESPVGIVSGSGIDLRSMLDEVLDEQTFADIAGISGSGIVGHDGVFVFGRCAGVAVILQAGRIHLYEGHPPEVVASTVDVLYRLGVRELLLTNAVGGLDGALTPGALVAVDRIETWRYLGHAFPRYLVPEMVLPGCDAQGTCMWMHGPCYETRAEIRALQRLGALVVGMSLPLEIQRCQVLGIRTGVVSCVTNDCTHHESELTHNEVVETARRASHRLAELLKNYLVNR